MEWPDDNSTDQTQWLQQNVGIVLESFIHQYSILDRLAAAAKPPNTLPTLDGVHEHAVTLLGHAGDAVDRDQLLKAVWDELYNDPGVFAQDLDRTSLNPRLFRTTKGFLVLAPVPCNWVTKFGSSMQPRFPSH
jgi:hypothetical protein